MVLKNNYGKEFIIVDDKEFIYNGRLRKRTIKSLILEVSFMMIGFWEY